MAQNGSAMKILHTNQNGWGSKINFVDDNNVLVGFDADQSCCERFGWFISESMPTSINDSAPEPSGLEPFNFDPAFFQSLNFGEPDDYCVESAAVFRLVNGNKELFLTLHNTHNGYYSHGFEMNVGGKTIYEGNL